MPVCLLLYKHRTPNTIKLNTQNSLSSSSFQLFIFQVFLFCLNQTNIKLHVFQHMSYVPNHSFGHESGPRGSVWAQTQPEWILRPTGTFLNPSRPSVCYVTNQNISNKKISTNSRSTAPAAAIQRTPIGSYQFWPRIGCPWLGLSSNSARMNPTASKNLLKPLPALCEPIFGPKSKKASIYSQTPDQPPQRLPC